MPYKDSYVAKIRKIIGHDFELVMPTTDVVIENKKGELLMIYNRDFAGWAFPGGYIEPEMSWQENAAREVLEEAGIHADSDKLKLMGAISGRNFVARYPNGDTAKLYTNVFLLNDWLSEDNNVDETEIGAKKWVSPQTIDHMHLTFSGQAVYRIYRQYKKTNSVQVLTLNSELQRFIDAQNGEIVGVSSYEYAVIELENGQKKTHWMWFVVPQLSGLGRSERAIYYGIHDQKEAYAYLNDAILKKRLEKIITITLTLETNDPVLVFGAVDAEKFQASLTLFSQISSSMLYKQALDKYFNGQKHVKTLALLQ
ncbi:DUF1810 family protein [Leuconostoc gasicomitatum]|uniref:DUF1810 family protein n=1 Tax=Leuconostoc gasicomitatum TaxID=115778 RepID=UPI001CC5F7C2|nr:DUF1810 family protein [Leuconostoc gasicomitatum]MBZ5969138.1 DUF1810 family protein [Leuconostoc gasicomitatum]MBZ5998379.1 DUF1810 family protein [Leuconostoc gasicomitatum]